MKKDYVVDTEWSGLDATQLWCVVFRPVEGGSPLVLHYPVSDKEFYETAQNVRTWIGHNFLSFDYPALRRHFPFLRIDTDDVVDTLVVSRYLNFDIEGGHSLEAWSRRLGGPQKIGIEDFSKYSQELVERCVSDTAINLLVYERFKRYLENKEFFRSIRLEHHVQALCNVLHEDGFAFDIAGASDLLNDLRARLRVLDVELKSAFPPVSKVVEILRPRVTQSGTIHAQDFKRLLRAGYKPEEITGDQDYDIVEVQEFNPGSLKQIIERLNEAGWKPTSKTKGHKEAIQAHPRVSQDRLDHFQVYGWKLDDENLTTLPDTAPAAAKRLTERLLLASRIGVLEKWLHLAVLDPDGQYRIHGRFQGIGAWTQRMSHSEPNMANVPKSVRSEKDNELKKLSNDVNDKMRSFWIASKDHRLVGVDADGIQMRVFAHYVDDQRLTDALLKGSKSDGTDIHSLHKRALGEPCRSRDAAKTFIYAWLLGASTGKVAEILECSHTDAAKASADFLGFYPGLKDLKKSRIPADAARGYFIGLDGRPVCCSSRHHMLAGYLQNGEAVIQKLAAHEWTQRLWSEGVPFRFVNFVHDEFQIEVPEEFAEYVASVVCQSIVDAGLYLDLKIPLAGSAHIGSNWLETH